MIAAVVGVKDEVELIDRVLQHLQTIGVELVLVCDIHSTDGTLDVLEPYERDGFVRVRKFTMTENFEDVMPSLVAELGADWVLLMDGDEFPVPASGNLADCAALAEADLVTVPRYNVPLGPAGPAIPDVLRPARYDELLLIAEPLDYYANLVDEQPELSWMLARLVPKSLVRPAFVGDVVLGMHHIEPPPGLEARRATATDLFIAHVPFTTFTRFARKADTLVDLFEIWPDAFPPGSALHWRRWAELAQYGGLAEEFARMSFDEETIAELRAAGRIRSAAELFENVGVV